MTSKKKANPILSQNLKQQKTCFQVTGKAACLNDELLSHGKL